MQTGCAVVIDVEEHTVESESHLLIGVAGEEAVQPQAAVRRCLIAGDAGGLVGADDLCGISCSGGKGCPEARWEKGADQEARSRKTQKCRAREGLSRSG